MKSRKASVAIAPSNTAAAGSHTRLTKQQSTVSSTRSFDPRKKWREAIFKVKFANATSGIKPMYPIEQIHDLKQYFTDKRSGHLKELEESEFVDIFQNVLKNRRYSKQQLIQWFRDIDVDISKTVSWEEFTSFMIYQASAVAEGNQRSKEIVFDQHPTHPVQQDHRAYASRIAFNERVPNYVTVAGDGLVKVWSPNDCECKYTINNNTVCATHKQITPGSQPPIVNIVDVVFHHRGTHLFVVGADKTLNIYDAQTWALTRKFFGKESIISEADQIQNQRKDVRKKRELIETTTMLGMKDNPASFDVAAPNDRELMFWGYQGGGLGVYLSSRHAYVPEIYPIATFSIHHDAISKARFSKSLGALITASWDSTLKLVDVETGDTLSCLDGGGQKERHYKAVTDFAFCPGLRLLGSVGAERHVLLWNPHMPMALAKFDGHGAPLSAVAFDEIDRQLITLDQDHVIKVWDLRTNRLFQSVAVQGGQASSTASASPDSVFVGPPTKFSTMTYDTTLSKVVCAGTRVNCWSIRRSLSIYPPNHQGHIDPPQDMIFAGSVSMLVTCDANVIGTWRALSGFKLLNWDANPPPSTNPICALGIDESERKLLVGLKNGDLTVFNFKNGQQLRHSFGASTAEPIRITHLTNRDNTSRIIAVVSPKEITLFGDVPDVQGLLPKNCEGIIRAGEDSAFTCVSILPAVGSSTPTNVVVGTYDGMIQVYSPTTLMLSGTTVHPRRTRTRQHLKRSRDNSRFLSLRQLEAVESDVSSIRPPVEDIQYLPKWDLSVSCVGDSTLFFWDLRRSVLVLTYSTLLTPEECTLCLSHHSESQLLFSSCDYGFVYIRDISALPPAGSELSCYDTSQIVLLRVFRAHNSTITKLLATPENLAITLSSIDTYIKIFTTEGQLMGYYGQETIWKYRHTSTYGAQKEGYAVEDEHPLPRPMTSGAMRLSRKPSTGFTSPAGANSSKTKFTAASFLTETTSPSQLEPPGGGGAGEAGGASSFITQFVSMPTLTIPMSVETDLEEKPQNNENGGKPPLLKKKVVVRTPAPTTVTPGASPKRAKATAPTSPFPLPSAKMLCTPGRLDPLVSPYSRMEVPLPSPNFQGHTGLSNLRAALSKKYRTCGQIQFADIEDDFEVKPLPAEVIVTQQSKTLAEVSPHKRLSRAQVAQRRSQSQLGAGRSTTLLEALGPRSSSAFGFVNTSRVDHHTAADISFLYKLKQTQGDWQAARLVKPVRIILNPLKSKEEIDAMTKDPKGWVGRASSLLHVGGVDLSEIKNPASKQLKQLKEL